MFGENALWIRVAHIYPAADSRALEMISVIAAFIGSFS
jgi:hypothetical protein